MTKKEFIKLHLKENINIDHMSYRQIDYKFYEYKLYLILSNYIYDFSILGLPSNLTIKSNPSKEDYNILRRSHVTLNYELYKLYECGYFTSERSFIKYVIAAMIHYKNETATIKDIVKVTRNKRLQYIKEPFI